MNLFKNLHKKYKHIFLFLILILAGFLRLYKIDEYMTFLGDEGRDMLVVYNILHGKFTFLGPTASVGGFFMGPVYYYFMTPFLWFFNYNPIGPSVMVALFGIATVVLVYKVGFEFFNKSVGIIASALYTISPLVVAYSRSSWNPNLMPFFSLLTVYSVYKSVKTKKLLLFILPGFFLGIAIQLHYVELALIVTVGVYIAFLRIYEYIKNKNRSIQTIILPLLKQYFFVLLGFLLGFSPFLAFEIRHGFPNLISIVKFVFFSGDTGGNSNFITTVGSVFFRIFARTVTKFPPPEQLASLNQLQLSVWFWISLSLGLLSVFLFLMQYIKALKENVHVKRLSVLFLWFFLGILFFGFYKKSIYDYYFEFMFPLPFLFVANFFYYLWNKNLFLKTTAGICFVWLVYINFQGVPFRFPPNRQLNQAKTIAQFVLEQTQGKPFNFALITGGNSDHAYKYFFKLAGRDPVVIEYEGIDPQRNTVTDQLLVVCEKIPCEPVGNGLWEIAGFGRADIAGVWDVSVVKVYKLIPHKGS